MSGVPATSHDVVIVGAGFAGMYLVRKLRDELGLDVRVFERGDDVGGTWYWNRYPGARCDVESMFYSYSFDADLEREWDWSERFAAQPEILAYACHVADRFDLRRSIVFGATVTDAQFVNDGWTITMDTGEQAQAHYLIFATGCLSVPLTPSFQGLDRFGGDVYHTGDWPHRGVDFTGQRVAVIGTGSSGIQTIPLIAEQARTLTVLQRTATFSVPARNRPLADADRRATRDSYPALRDVARWSAGGTISDQPIGTSDSVPAKILDAELERRWWLGGTALVGTLADSILSHEANQLTAEFVRRKVREAVRDEETARLLEPRDYPISTKRIVLDTDYYDTFNRDNVSLVSLRERPLEAFTETGAIIGGEVHEFDAVVLATGYDAMTGAINRIRVRGRDGTLLTDEWSAGPVNYLGLAVSGFPNMFMVTGPGSPSVLSNVLVSIEQHVEWIAELLKSMRRDALLVVEADRHAQDSWVSLVNTIASHTLFPEAASWYMGANVPGKPRVFMPYLGGVGTYRELCDDVAREGYRGFVFEGAASGTVFTEPSTAVAASTVIAEV